MAFIKPRTQPRIFISLDKEGLIDRRQIGTSKRRWIWINYPEIFRRIEKAEKEWPDEYL